MGIFGTGAETIFEINLIIQIALLVLLLIGVARRRTLRFHGTIMATAIIVNIITVLTIMGPSLVLYSNLIIAAPFSPGNLITIIHVILGLVALLSGLIFSIRFMLAIRRSGPLACGTRRMMQLTALLWISSLIGGIGFYMYFYI
ncbi:MAG: hypothetical protein ACW97A_01255 [Candidatus Thorarchaeota archaeon]|jgi:hypothetical protein